MKSAEIFEILDNSEDLDSNREILRVFLLEQLARYDQEPTNGEAIAYVVAGLLGAKSIMHLSPDDPYSEIIDLASSLELPPTQRDTDSTWEKFASLVRHLPNS